MTLRLEQKYLQEMQFCFKTYLTNAVGTGTAAEKYRGRDNAVKAIIPPGLWI
jgi:hypothetical protein